MPFFRDPRGKAPPYWCPYCRALYRAVVGVLEHGCRCARHGRPGGCCHTGEERVNQIPPVSPDDLRAAGGL